MCDTLVALSNATADGSVIFAKNSDREPNEAQEIVLYPAADYPVDSRVKCTYLEIPQSRHTFRTLLSKPYWMWGAEMGANEHGVVIGNEALFTKISHNHQPALTGMDLLRLALERSDSAETALDCILGLLMTYGQGGSGSPSHEFLYHNSFLIADKKSAWVLETAGQQWAARQVVDTHSISNVLSLHDQWDKASPDLKDEAIKRKWSGNGQEFDFSKSYSDHLYTPICAARYRQGRSSALLESKHGKITPRDMFQILRDHGDQAHPESYSPARGLLGAQICMHLGAGPIRTAIGQTTCSMVAHLSEEGMTLWITGTAAPCTGIFKPVWIESGLPEMGPPPGEKYDPDSLWWQHERLHRAVMRDYANRIRMYQDERDRMELRFHDSACQVIESKPVDRLEISRACFEEARQATSKWTEMVGAAPLKNPASRLFQNTWKGYNRQVGFPD